MRLGEATTTSRREINETDRTAGSGSPAGPVHRPSDTNPERERGELFSSGVPLDTEVIPTHEKMLLLSHASKKTPYQQLNDFVNS